MVTTFKEPEKHTCDYCGHIGTDLHRATDYEGGCVQKWYCDDANDCQARGEALDGGYKRTSMGLNKYQEPEKCAHCGHIGVDVHPDTGYIGGLGYVQKWFCDDADACWQRRDAQYQIKER